MTSSFRTASPAEIFDALQDAHANTLGIFECFSQVGMDALDKVPAMPFLNPPLWDYWQMKNYRLFTLKYGDAFNPKSTMRHCVFMAAYPRSQALENQIRQENRYLCSGVFAQHDVGLPTVLRKVPAYGRLWNVQVDSSVFDFTEPTNFMDVAISSGYLQEDVTAMLVQLAFEKDLDMVASPR